MNLSNRMRLSVFIMTIAATVSVVAHFVNRSDIHLFLPVIGPIVGYLVDVSWTSRPSQAKKWGKRLGYAIGFLTAVAWIPFSPKLLASGVEEAILVVLAALTVLVLLTIAYVVPKRWDYIVASTTEGDHP